MSVDTLTVVPQNSNGIPFFSRSLSLGTCSPTTTTALGTTPLVNLVYDYFGFTLIRFDGYFDNSSITSFDLTPSGGSTITFNVDAYGYYSSDDETQFGSSDDDRNLVAGTTYTIRLYSGSTNIGTERTTLERRDPASLDDFYGATRNVPPISGAFKLSWLKNAVKYQWTTSMTAGFFYDSFNGYNYHGYGGVYPSMGSMGSTAPSGILNLYNGKTIINLYNLNTSGTNYVTLAFQTSTDGSIPGSNSQWYKLQVGSAAFYREDATFSYNTSSPYFTVFTWNTGSTQHISNGNTYTIKLTC